MMKFFKNPVKWKEELAAIGLLSGLLLIALSPLILGDPSGWLLCSSLPLLLPLIFGNRKQRIIGIAALVFVAVVIISSQI